MWTIATGIAGKALGWLLGNPLILGAILIFLAYNFGYWLGERDGTRDMVSKLEIASKEAEIANLKNEKAIAEAAAKQATTDNADLETLTSQKQGEIDELVKKIKAAGKECRIPDATMCRRYGVSCDKGNGGKQKAVHSLAGVAQCLRPAPPIYPASCG